MLTTSVALLQKFFVELKLNASLARVVKFGTLLTSRVALELWYPFIKVDPKYSSFGGSKNVTVVVFFGYAQSTITNVSKLIHVAKVNSAPRM